MWHIVYIIAFAVLAILAITNLVRNLILLGGNTRRAQSFQAKGGVGGSSRDRRVPHPELLDQDGQMIREPLLVMRSISVKDAREQLDSLYEGQGSSLDDSDTDPDVS
jgi:hypothetical protein